MRKDSRGKTGEQVMGKISSDTLAMLYTGDIQRELWNELMKIARKGTNREKITAIKEIFDRTLGKPKQAIDANMDMRLEVIKKIITSSE